MNTKRKIQRATHELREQALLLEVYCEDEKIARTAAKKILHVVRGLEPFEDRECIGRLLTAARNLEIAAKLLNMARSARTPGSKIAAKLLALARDLQAPNKLVAIAHQLANEPQSETRA